MAGDVVARKQNVKRRTKVKTGCATCRIRKVKCDEKKPSCQRCVSTGRTCDGYESPFRLVAINNTAHVRDTISFNLIVRSNLQPVRSIVVDQITPQDIDLLHRYFSIKTMFDVKLGCDEDARQVLQASLTNPPIRHAISSLRALREDLEISGDGAACDAQQSPRYHYGLQQYGMAVGGLASNLSTPDFNGMRSALLCCKVFISIEQVWKNYAAMAQHIIRGLRIMHEFRARPSLFANELVPACHEQLPLLDVFFIKLFAAPCKFKEPVSETVSVGLASPDQQPVGSLQLCTIAPDVRTQLHRIAASTLEFLEKVSQVKSAGVAIRLLSEKAALLESLKSWLANLDIIHKESGSGLETISVSFLRFFHQALKIVLLGALESSIDLDAELQIENDTLQNIANNANERAKNYSISSGASGGRGERATPPFGIRA